MSVGRLSWEACQGPGERGRGWSRSGTGGGWENVRRNRDMEVKGLVPAYTCWGEISVTSMGVREAAGASREDKVTPGRTGCGKCFRAEDCNASSDLVLGSCACVRVFQINYVKIQGLKPRKRSGLELLLQKCLVDPHRGWMSVEGGGGQAQERLRTGSQAPSPRSSRGGLCARGRLKEVMWRVSQEMVGAACKQQREIFPSSFQRQ